MQIPEEMKNLIMMNELRRWITLTLLTACVAFLFNQKIDTKPKKLLLGMAVLWLVPIVASYIETLLAALNFVGPDYMMKSSYFWPWLSLASTCCFLAYIFSLCPPDINNLGGVDMFKHVWFSFEGRISRMDYWLKGMLPAMALVGIPAIMLAAMPQEWMVLVMRILIAIIGLWISTAVAVKRLHDSDISGWFSLIIFVPLLGALVLMYFLWFLKGTEGSNRFGPVILRTVENDRI